MHIPKRLLELEYLDVGALSVPDVALSVTAADTALPSFAQYEGTINEKSFASLIELRFTP